MQNREDFSVSFDNKKTGRASHGASVKKGPSGFTESLYMLVSSVSIGILVLFVLFAFFVRAAKVDGDSMQPTLSNNDWLVVDSLFYTPSKGDMVIISRDGSDETPLVKRIIATAGDEVDIDFDTHTVKVNGLVLDETYIAEPISRHGDYSFPVTVPEGCVFVLGDNRNNSLDSRFKEIGFVNTDYLLGKVIYRIFPSPTSF